MEGLLENKETLHKVIQYLINIKETGGVRLQGSSCLGGL